LLGYGFQSIQQTDALISDTNDFGSVKFEGYPTLSALDAETCRDRNMPKKGCGTQVVFGMFFTSWVGCVVLFYLFSSAISWMNKIEKKKKKEESGQ